METINKSTECGLLVQVALPSQNAIKPTDYADYLGKIFKNLNLPPCPSTDYYFVSLEERENIKNILLLVVSNDFQWLQGIEPLIKRTIEDKVTQYVVTTNIICDSYAKRIIQSIQHQDNPSVGFEAEIIFEDLFKYFLKVEPNQVKNLEYEELVELLGITHQSCGFIQYIPIQSTESGAETYINILSKIYGGYNWEIDPKSLVILGFDKKKVNEKIQNFINVVILSNNTDWLHKLQEIIKEKTDDLFDFEVLSEVVCNSHTSNLLNNKSFDSVDSDGEKIDEEVLLYGKRKVFIESGFHHLTDISTESELGEFIKKHLDEVHL